MFLPKLAFIPAAATNAAHSFVAYSPALPAVLYRCGSAESGGPGLARPARTPTLQARGPPPQDPPPAAAGWAGRRRACPPRSGRTRLASPASPRQASATRRTRSDLPVRHRPLERQAIPAPGGESQPNAGNLLRRTSRHPGATGSPKRRCTEGSAKLASTSSTRRVGQAAAATAKCASTVLTPSPREQLVSPTARGGCGDWPRICVR